MTALAFLADAAIRALALALVVGTGLAICRVRRTSIRLFVWTLVLYASIGLAVAGRLLPQIPVALPSAANGSVARVTTILTSEIRPAAAATLELSSVVAVIYLLGAVWLLGRVALGWMVTRRLERSARSIDDGGVLARLDQLARASGLRRSPRLAASDRLFVPLATSVLRPAILLPADWRAWDTAKIDAVFAHELAHIARGDVLTQRVALLYRAIVWPSPLGWWLHRRVTDLAEQASDEAALHAGVDPASYAETLLGFFAVRPDSARRADWNVAMARGAASSAGRRIDFVLAWDGAGARVLSRGVALAVALTIAPVLTLAAALEPVRRTLPALPALAAVITRPIISTPSNSAASHPSTIPVRAPRVTAAVPTASRPINTPAPAPTVAASASLVISEAAVAVAPPPVSPLDVRDAAIADPVLLSRVDAKYTVAAMEAKIQGVVWLDVVVRADGRVGDVTIAKSLDAAFGLDAQAIAAAKQWTFAPATRLDALTGARVGFPTTARLELDFRLR